MSSKLTLLTTPTITTEQGQYLIPADKRGALLIYLACKEDWLQREQISFLFWPDRDDKTAKGNLRQLISRTKKLPFANSMEQDDQHLRWSVELDSTTFREAIAAQDWARAIELYQGTFCEAYTAKDANGFQDWVQLEREGYASAFAGAVRQFSESLLQQGNHKQAADLLKRVLQQDELAEDIVQRYLQAAYLGGQRDEALLYYKQFSEQLKVELELEPLEETQTIVKIIEQSQPLVLQDSKVKSVVSSQVVPLSVMRPPKLVGRQNSIEQAQASFATLIVLMGEAGIGKTRLMAELAPEAVLIKAEESLSNVPFHAIAEFIKKQTEHPLEALGVYVNDLVRLIPDVAPHIKAGPAEVFTAKQRLLEALVRYFEAIAVAKDFAIAFDDIQWLDENSLEFLALLHNRGNLKLIATCRKYEAPKHLTELINTLASTEVINIEALSFEDIQSLLAELMDKDVQPTLFAKWLHNNTSGNIMFVLETLKSLFESGDLRADEDGWHSNLDEVTKDYSELVLPKLVADLIQRRIEPLSEEVKRVLQGAAVISNNINEKILSQITGLSQWSVLEAVELGQTVGVLTGTSFKHDLLRQSIYSNLSKSKRSFLHARVAETLDSRNTDKSSKDNLLIAQHWLDAYEEEKAARAILEAVRQQFHIGLHSEAIKNLEHYVDLELEQSLKHEIQYLLCILFMDSGQLDKSTVLLETLSQQSKDPIMQAQVMCSQLKIGINQGRTQEVEDIFSELQKLETSHELPIGVKRDILANKAVIAHYKGEYDNSIKLQLESNELCRQLGDKLSLALGLSSLGAVYDYAGRYDDALSSYNESLKISQSLNALHLQQEVALNIVSCYADMGRHDEAIDVGLTALKLGRYDATDFLRNNLAAAYFEVNQNDEAIQQFESLIAETENNTLKCNAWARLIKLYGDQMQFDKQKTALKQSLILVRETSSPTPVSRVIISCLEHGSDEDKIAARALLKGLDINSVPPVARAELQQVLKDHT